MQAPKSRRQHARYSVELPIQVVNSNTNNIIGTLVNISRGGLLIVGDQALTENKLYQLELKLTKPVLDKLSIKIAVDCLWHESADQSGQLVWSGCQIIDCIDEEVNYLVEAMAQSSQLSF